MYHFGYPDNMIRLHSSSFHIIDGGSCGYHPPTLFKYSDWITKAELYVDSFLPIGRKQPVTDVPRFGWLCESHMIQPNIYNEVGSCHQEYAKVYRKIFTCLDELASLSPLFQKCLPGSNLPWIERKDFGLYPKTKTASMFSSRKTFTKGHQYRREWAEKLNGKVDVFGGDKELNRPWLDKKVDGLKDYQYSIVVENTESSGYFTEKLTDCFATGTIPVYWGDPSIGRIFDERGIIKLTNDFKLEELTLERYCSMLPYIWNNYRIIQNMEVADDYVYRMISDNLDRL